MPEPRYVFLVVAINENDERNPVLAVDRQDLAQEIADRIGGEVFRLLLIEVSDE